MEDVFGGCSCSFGGGSGFACDGGKLFFTAFGLGGGGNGALVREVITRERGSFVFFGG
jgi:hypothetical protein